MSQGRSTINTILKVGTTAGSISKISPIKTYPALFGSPDRLETTDLEDSQQTFVPGVQSIGDMNFTINHDSSWFSAYKALEGAEQIFELSFGEAQADGVYSWKGYLTISINEGSVNGIRECTLAISPTSVVKVGTAASNFSGTT